MRDPEASRLTAHVFLDAAAVHDHDDLSNADVRDDMTELAMQRLAEIGSIEILQDEDTGRISLDFARAGTGIIAVIVTCLQGWATSAGLDRDQVISTVRGIIDDTFADELSD